MGLRVRESVLPDGIKAPKESEKNAVFEVR